MSRCCPLYSTARRLVCRSHSEQLPAYVRTVGKDLKVSDVGSRYFSLSVFLAEKLYVFVQLLQKYVRVKFKNSCLHNVAGKNLEVMLRYIGCYWGRRLFACFRLSFLGSSCQITATASAVASLFDSGRGNILREKNERGLFDCPRSGFLLAVTASTACRAYLVRRLLCYLLLCCHVAFAP